MTHELARATGRSNSGESIESCTTQDIQKYGLGLIVGRMTSENIARKGLIASLTGSSFKIGTLPDRDGQRLKIGTN
jgi:hypothetical protein